MKKLLFIFAITFCHFYNVSAQKEKLNQLLDKYQDTEGVTSIKIAKAMFGMLNSLNIKDSELDQVKPLLNKIQGLKILILEKPEKAGDQKLLSAYQNLSADISASVKNLKYEELITVNSKDNKIKFLVSDAQNGMLDNLLLNISSEGNTILMMLDGKISMEDVNKLVNEAQKNNARSSEETSPAVSEGKSRKVEPFTGIEVSTGVKVNFTQSATQSVTVDVDPGMEQHISTVVENGILKISVVNKGKQNLNFTRIFVNVSAPHLNYLKTKSGSNLTTLNTVKEKNAHIITESGSSVTADFTVDDAVKLETNSGANLKLTLKTNHLDVKADSGANATISGKAKFASFEVTSAAHCNAQNLDADNVTVQASSAGNISVKATENLNAKASTAGTIQYTGNPKIINTEISKSTGGKLKEL